MANDTGDVPATGGRTYEVLLRLHAASAGNVEVEVSFAKAASGVGLDYLGARNVLGTMLQRQWIVRHGRDAVTLTARGVDAAKRAVMERG